MSQPARHVDYEHLLGLLTAERLGSYLDAANSDIEAAFALYEWNIEVAAAALSLTAMGGVWSVQAWNRVVSRGLC